jgi:WD40 repeat protein
MTPVKNEYLKQLNPARMDAVSRSECLPDTRQNILKFIIDWLTTPYQGQNVFWLYGLAGSGKSTISTTIAEYFRELGRLGAFMFFDRNNATTNNPSAVIRTLAYKLAYSNPSIKAEVCSQIEVDPGIVEAPMHVQVTKLLLEPLSKLAILHTQGPVIIIIDALDECGDPMSRKDLLSLLARNLAKFPHFFRFLVTSRREFDIEGALSHRPNVVSKELDITDQSNVADISNYLRYHMAAIAENGMFSLAFDWPGEEYIQSLVQSSSGLFIWASTAVKFIADGHHPEQRLRVLLHSQSRVDAETALDTLYGIALNAAGKWDDDAVVEDFRAVLGTIVVGKIPLADTALDRILGLSKHRSSTFILSRLRCLLHWSPGQPARTLHPSFADYLSNAHRCGNQPWFIDLPTHHRRLALTCFQQMQAGLKFNICRLETSYALNRDVLDLPARVDNFIPSHLSYACRFWADHLRGTGFELGVSTHLEKFLYLRFLYWLETLSLIEEMHVASPALQSSAEWATVSLCIYRWSWILVTFDIQGHAETVATFAMDAIAFVSTFRIAISRSAPHIYLSALPFSPIKSLVASQFCSQFPQGLSIEIGRMTHWPEVLHVLEGHTSGVLSVAMSPDGRQIASSSRDRTIRVWDMDTGGALIGTFEGHTDVIWSVAFSPDGKHIASGSSDQTIRVWLVETGEIVSEPFKGHSAIRSVAFSPDGKKIVSGSDNSSIQVWNVESSENISTPFKGHTGLVNAVAFTPDGTRIVSGSADMTIRIWNVERGEVASGPFKGHMAPISSLAVSFDGRWIVSGSSDRTVRVWNAETGKVVSRPFEGHTGPVTCVAFSHDGRQIVSSSTDLSVRVWNTETGKVISGPFEGHTSEIQSVAFSPRGEHIVSCSEDHTIRVWRARTGEVLLGSTDGHTMMIWSIALSADGKRVVSGSGDRTIRVWDADTGATVAGPFGGHTGQVMSVAFSPDGTLVASGSEDTTIRVWNAKTGEAVLGPLDQHTDWVRSVVFSPDGKLLASGSSDRTVRVWNTETNHMISGPYTGHTHEVWSVAFSPGSDLIVSGSADATIRIWNANTGEVVSGPFQNNTSTVRSVAFSPNGRHIVSGSRDASILVWNAETGEVEMALRPIDKSTSRARSVAFSPDGTLITSGFNDMTVRVLNAETGRAVIEPLHGHTDEVMSTIFSPDGKRIVSCSMDQTIRVWASDFDNGVASSRNSPIHDFRQEMHGAASAGFYHTSRMVDGWLLGRQSELLFWVPPANRVGLWRANNTAVMGRQTTKLNFRQFVHGTSWIKCRETLD